MKRPPHLVLFFTRGVSLQTWNKVGIFDREIAVYQAYIDRGWKVSFLTYGDKRDLELQKKLGDIEVLCNHWKLPDWLYRRNLYLFHADALSKANVFKTNQLIGAEKALQAAKYWKKPLVVRCGYLWTSVAEQRLKVGLSTEDELNKTRKIESQVFPSSERVIVTSTVMKKYIHKTYGLPDRKVEVVPNYIRTDLFYPAKLSQGKDNGKPQLISVTRLTEQKNLPNLICALEGLNVTLTLVGSGPLKSQLENLAREKDVELKLLEQVPNNDMPKLLHSSAMAVLVSHFEGHPKALIEAMSCGLPVIGSDVPGIREIILHRKNGYLCKTDTESIRLAIVDVLNNPTLQETMGKNAREFVIKHYSLPLVFQNEKKILENVIDENSDKMNPGSMYFFWFCIHPAIKCILLIMKFMTNFLANFSRTVRQLE